MESTEKESVLHFSGRIWMRWRADGVLSARAYNLHAGRELAPEFDAGDVMPRAEAARLIMEAVVRQDVDPEVMRAFANGEPRLAFQMLMKDPITISEPLGEFSAGALHEKTFIVNNLREQGRKQEAVAIDGFEDPTQADFGREVGRSLLKDLERARIPSDVMKHFYAGKVVRGLMAVAADEDAAFERGFRAGAQFLREKLIEVCAPETTRPARPEQNLRTAYDAGHYDARASDTNVIRSVIFEDMRT